MAIKAPHRRTPEQIARDDARLHTKALGIYETLNKSHTQLAFPTIYGARLGNAAGHVYIQLDVEGQRLYIHALPWSRGYAIFVHTMPEVTSMDWRTVDRKHKGLQRSIYAPRGRVGAWHVADEQIIDAMRDYAIILDKYERARKVARWPKDMATAFSRIAAKSGWTTVSSYYELSLQLNQELRERTKWES